MGSADRAIENMMKKHKILIIGCGALGSRHLQAVASLAEVSQVHVVDCSPKAAETGKLRLEELSDLNKAIKFSWFNELNQDSANGDLCIIATQADVRCDIVKQVANKLGYKKFLIEKIVSQSVEDYQDLMTFCKVNGLLVWVNCKNRTYAIHEYIKSCLNVDEPLLFSVVGGNHGLANIGVHVVDLFVFFDESKQLKSFGAQIDPIVHSSKRGPQVCDLSGSICGYSDKGSKFMISFAGDNRSPDHTTIHTPSSRFIIDHFQKFAYESHLSSDWQWRNIAIDENWNVSHMSKAFVADILTKDNCQLPTLSQCFLSHQFILRELLPHFNRLLKKEDNYCPVT